MDFFKVLDMRRSIRAYDKKPIEEEKLQKLLQAINSAPSAGNLQAYEVVVVKDELTRSRLSKAALGQHFVAEAPIVLVFFQNPLRSSSKYGSRGDLYSLQDATIAAAYTQLAAVALDLGSCWVGAFDPEKVKVILNSPDHLVPVAIIPMGYFSEYPSHTPRRNLNDLVHEEGFKTES